MGFFLISKPPPSCPQFAVFLPLFPSSFSTFPLTSCDLFIIQLFEPIPVFEKKKGNLGITVGKSISWPVIDPEHNQRIVDQRLGSLRTSTIVLTRGAKPPAQQFFCSSSFSLLFFLLILRTSAMVRLALPQRLSSHLSARSASSTPGQSRSTSPLRSTETKHLLLKVSVIRVSIEELCDLYLCPGLLG